MVERKIIFIVLATLGVYLLFTEKGMEIVKIFSQNLIKNGNVMEKVDTSQKDLQDLKDKLSDTSKLKQDKTIPHAGYYDDSGDYFDTLPEENESGIPKAMYYEDNEDGSTTYYPAIGG